MNKEKLILCKNFLGFDHWCKYDDNGNIIYSRSTTFSNFEYWAEYDEKGRKIYLKNSEGFEQWYEYYKNTKIEISKEEFEENKKIKEYNSRTKCSRFEIMEI